MNHIVEEESKHLDKQIKEILTDKHALQQQFLLIDQLSSRIDPILASTLELSSEIEETSILADTISGKVRRIDKIRDRVKQAKDHIQDILDIKECADGVQNALFKEDYAAAAHFIERYLKINPELIDADSKMILSKANETLITLLNKNIEVALKSGNQNEMLKYCKMYFPLGKSKLAVIKYGEFLCLSVDTIIDTLKKDLGDSKNKITDEKINYAVALAKLLRDIEILLKDQRPIIDENFGVFGMVAILQAVQLKTEHHCLPLLKQFQVEWKLQQYNNQIRAFEKASSSLSIKRVDNKNELSDLPLLLDQLSSISQAIEAHRRFIVSLTKKYQDNLTKSMEEKKEKKEEMVTIRDINSLYSFGEVDSFCHELLVSYLTVENHFMNQCIQKVLQANTQDSSIVNEVFLILKECCNRSRQSYNVDTICAFINLVDTLLNESLRTYFYNQANLKTVGNLDLCLNGLNNLELVCTYIPQLRQDIEIPCQKSFKTMPVQFQKIVSSLDTLNSTQRRLRTLLQNSLETLFNSVSTKIQQQLESISGYLEYEITQTQFNQNQLNVPIIQQFIQNLDLLFTPHKRLSETNLDLLMHSNARYVIEFFEQVILKKKFSKYGAKQLDKDYMALLGYFSSNSKRSMREKFERLQQISDLLNIDEVTDVVELVKDWEDSGSSQFSSSEILKIVSLRTDIKSKLPVLSKLLNK
uniref:Conserved oligomeric Golgi complex subunit 4 n=1 Tax=Arcella intermedia TaxID=1963864 RepID=A0A6B2KYT2_9EUKA